MTAIIPKPWLHGARDDPARRWQHASVDESWKERAACQGEDPRLWFPNEDGQRHYERRVRKITAKARAICERCPVQGECLGFAIDTDTRYGMFGGLTERERAEITGKRPE